MIMRFLLRMVIRKDYKKDKFHEIVKIDGMKITFILDSGADIMILPYQIYENLKDKAVLETRSKKVYPFTSYTFSIEGECQLLCQINKIEKFVPFLISKQCDIPIIGAKSYPIARM